MGKLHADYCVAFIDILGFKSMTDTREKLEKNAEIINDALDLMKKYRPEDKYGKLIGKTEIIQLQVSDSLVFVFPKDFCNTLVVFAWISTLQFSLAQKGIYIRGSINSGAMYIDKDNDRYFGEAWDKAVLAEGRVVTPRILIEPSVAAVVQEALNKINEGVLEFFLDQDGEIVLTSYTPLVVMSNLKPANRENLLQAYAELFKNMSDQIENARDNPYLLQKYLWITRHIIEPYERDEVIINLVQDTEEVIIRYLTKEIALDRVPQKK